MSVVRDFRIISRMLLGSGSRSSNHAERMERFYASQADDYDAFREKLLPGRAELLADITWPEQATVVDLGGGTGANLEWLPPDARKKIKQWTVVDLSPSLLAIARRRIKQKQWSHVSLAEADACTWQAAEPVDVVLFSYSLTMIPDWQAALRNASTLLKPGGQIAVVDFTIAANPPKPGLVSNTRFARFFWPKWFAWDGVYLNEDHVPALLQQFTVHSLVQSATRLPYLPGSRVPFYRFIGRSIGSR